MNEDIRWITNLLDAHNIPYWVDYGTLLGLMREGDLLKKGRKIPDSDIDISMWSKYEPRLQSILPLVEQRGYVVRKYSYNGLIYKYYFIPKVIDLTHHSVAFIDISLWWTHGDYAWSPDYYPLNPEKHRLIRYLFEKLGVVRYLFFLVRSVLWGWSKLQIRFMRKWITVDLCVWPWSAFYEVGTNWIPRSYFDNTTRAKHFDVLLPRDWERYLEFRYGNWKVPVEEWRYWLDDRKGFQRKTPHEIIKNRSKFSER